MDIRIRGLDPAPFQPLFDADPASPMADFAVIRTVESSPGSPCRVTLDDAAPGETVALLNYTHHDVATPFRSAHAIYVRRDAREAFDAVNTIPPAFARRTISLRGFDAEGWMLGFELVPGTEVLEAARRLLANPKIAYLHAHYAGAGCYGGWVGRA